MVIWYVLSYRYSTGSRNAPCPHRVNPPHTHRAVVAPSRSRSLPCCLLSSLISQHARLDAFARPFAPRLARVCGHGRPPSRSSPTLAPLEAASFYHPSRTTLSSPSIQTRSILPRLRARLKGCTLAVRTNRPSRKRCQIGHAALSLVLAIVVNVGGAEDERARRRVEALGVVV